MKIAYLIVAHNNPAHLQRLITALSSSSASFYVHIDKKSTIDPFLDIQGDRIHFTQARVPVFWGDFSQVEATLVLLRSALLDPVRSDRFVLLSGADYPLRSACSIEQFFGIDPGREFMNLVAMPCAAAGKPISRLTAYRLRPGDPLLHRAKQKILMMAGLLPNQRAYQDYLGALVPYGGSTWWALSREACDFILRFVTRESRAVQFFMNTLCPDESFFQTILGNSPFKSRIVRNLTYTDWSAGGASPENITERHLALFRTPAAFTQDDIYGSGEKLFARKFVNQSGHLVALLDRQIREQDGTPEPRAD